jgi:hypothetical protein
VKRIKLTQDRNKVAKLSEALLRIKALDLVFNGSILLPLIISNGCYLVFCMMGC